jgi:hypothetical protein
MTVSAGFLSERAIMTGPDGLSSVDKEKGGPQRARLEWHHRE